MKTLVTATINACILPAEDAAKLAEIISRSVPYHLGASQPEMSVIRHEEEKKTE